MMGGEVSDYRIITCHLGNGSSVAAVKYGKSIDTSMGYTPLDGLVMGTRSGEIDPAIIPFLIVKENMDAEQIDEYLNRRSGVLGISGLSSDFRDLESAAHRGDERSQLAIDVFAYRVKNISALIRRRWAAWTPLCLRLVWARILLPCARKSAKGWSISVPASTL